MPSQREVLLVDDHPVALAGLRLVLEKPPAWTVRGEARDANAARRLAEELQPDFIVLDLRLGGRDGLELVEDLHAACPAAQILVFSSLDEIRYAPRVLRAGARGLVAKDRDLDDVRVALERLAGGEYAFSAAVQRTLFDAAAGGRHGNPLDELSNRELQILRLLGEGRRTTEIAEELNLGVKTVGTYRERLKAKLRIADGRELEERAREFVGKERDVRVGKRE
ncbi:MAG TPA: response regulator transcription factor [Opitutus sp.]|nr:response regulator transcription factor [Opitutus sp.]